jgi:hypothetical protein
MADIESRRDRAAQQMPPGLREPETLVECGRDKDGSWVLTHEGTMKDTGSTHMEEMF